MTPSQPFSSPCPDKLSGYVTLEEIAQRTGKSQRTIERVLQAHPELKHLKKKIGRKNAYPWEEMEKYCSFLFSAVGLEDKEVTEAENALSMDSLQNEIQNLKTTLKSLEKHIRLFVWILKDDFMAPKEAFANLKIHKFSFESLQQTIKGKKKLEEAQQILKAYHLDIVDLFHKRKTIQWPPPQAPKQDDPTITKLSNS